MDELTTLFFLLAIGVFIVACLVKHYGVRFLSILMGAVSLFSLLMDDTMEQDWLILMLIVDFFIVGMGAAFVIDLDDEGRGRRR